MVGSIRNRAGGIRSFGRGRNAIRVIAMRHEAGIAPPKEPGKGPSPTKETSQTTGGVGKAGAHGKRIKS